MKRIILPWAKKENDWSLYYERYKKYMLGTPFIFVRKNDLIKGIDFGVNEIFTRRCLVSSRKWGIYMYGNEIYKGKLKKIK